jgi:hypothetical protein
MDGNLRCVVVGAARGGCWNEEEQKRRAKEQRKEASSPDGSRVVVAEWRPQLE